VAIDNRFKTLAKQELYLLYLVNRVTIRSNQGRVTYKTNRVIIKILKGHTKEI